MTALPGQRSAQQPLRAMTSAQRALGRAAQSGAGGLGTNGVAFVDGQTYDVDLSAPPDRRVRRVDSAEPPAEDTATGPDGDQAPDDSVGGTDPEEG